MAVTAAPYGAFLLSLTKGLFDLDTDVLKVALTTSTYVPNMDTHEFFDDVTDEITGTGYTAGGATLAGVTLTYDSTNNRAVLAADDVVWTGATFTAHYAVVYQSTGVAGTSRLIGYIDFGADKTYASEDFTLGFPQDVVRITAA